jgi:hypothetical protein
VAHPPEHTDDYTMAEIIRLLRAQGATIQEILTQTKLTNGNVIRHDGRLDVLDREMRDLKRAPAHPPAPAAPPSDDKKAGVLTLQIPMDAKTVVIVFSALASIVLLFLKGAPS